MKKFIVFMMVMISIIIPSKQIYAQMLKEYSNELVYMYIDNYQATFDTGGGPKLPHYRLCISNISNHKIKVRVLVHAVRESTREGREDKLVEIEEIINPEETRKVSYFRMSTNYHGDYIYANAFRVLSCKIVD